MVRKCRLLSQTVFFLLFLWLFFETGSRGADELGYPVKVFLDADPLIALTTMLATRMVGVFSCLALVTVALTAVLGRVFCGWVCPLGTLHNVIGVLNKKRGRRGTSHFFWVKYAILIFLVVSSLFSLQLTGIMDPISLLIRSLTVSVFPMLAYVGNAAVSVLKGDPGTVNHTAFLQGPLMGFLFFLILSLNLVERRFWCRYLCPLGALLGVLSRFALLRRSISEGCNECGRCESLCPSGIPTGKGSVPSECLLCGTCDDVCPKQAISYLRHGQKTTMIPIDMGRRRVVGAVTAGVISVPLVKLSVVKRASYASARLIRPPGARTEDEFLARCVKCGECMKVCITSGLQPALLEAGIEGLWSPVLVPRLGYCEYRCTLCGQVCPTGAIRRVFQSEKERIKIGLAVIDRDRCLPYAFSIPCIVCQEVCPTPKKAVILEREVVLDKDGSRRAIQRPKIDPELCVGCGICEARCPVIGAPAIYVIATGETRSKDKQFLL